MNIKAGQRFSHYMILELLGSGGMGVVYKAQDLRLKRTVALKLLLRREQSAGEVRRFLREAESAAALNHPRIAHVYEVDEEDGTPFLAMEFLSGGTLREWIAGAARPTVDELLRWSCDIAEALAIAHHHGIVHRDIKPTNVLLDQDSRAKLADFGLAKRLPSGREGNTDTHLTTRGVVMGTPEYMSPEQALGQDVGPPADVFSLGCVMYELATGLPPFQQGSTIDTLHAVVHDPAPSLGGCNLPSALRQLIERTLEKEQQKRPTARAVSDELSRMALARPEISEAPTEIRQTATGVFTSRWTPVLAAALVAVAISLFGWWWVDRRPPLDFKERETVVIGGIVNTTGEAVLEGSLQTALQMSLEQSTYVNVLSPERVRQALKRMRKSEVEKLTEPVAIEVCQREGARALLAGSVDRVGSRYVLSVRVVDPLTGSTVRTITKQASDREEILPALDDLARDLRRVFGESLGSIGQSSLKLAEATTSSLEALHLFTEGAELQKSGRLLEARDMYERALELDPEFARAYASLATTYRSIGDSHDDAQAERYFQEALKRLDRVAERERLEIQGLYHGVMSRYEAAARSYRLLVERYPTVEAYHNSLARQYGGLSRYEDAISEYEEALRLNPRSSGTLINLAATHGVLFQFRQQVDNMEKAFALEPEWETDETQNHQYGWALVLLNEEDRARKAFEKMLAQGGSKRARGYRSLGIVALYRGKLNEAAGQFEQAAHLNEVAGSPGSSARDILYFGEALALVGRHEGALRQLAHAVEFIKKGDYQPAFVPLRLSVVYSRLGKSESAARLIEAVKKHSPMVNQWDLIRAEGELLLSRGAAEEGLETLRRAHAISEGLLTQGSLARAFVLAGRREDALETYREIVSHQPLAWEGHVEWAVAHESLGRLYEKAGDAEQARAAYLKLLEIWKDADPDLPTLVDVRRALDRLTAVVS